MFPLEQFPKDAAVYTQRNLFNLVSSIFEPLGLLSPLTIRIKKILQQIWKLGKKWDELIPVKLQNALQKNLINYFVMPEIRMPRMVHNLSKNPAIQLHIFVDASITAMAAASYPRTTNSQTGHQQASFFIGKCKVATIKQLSVPKMELKAAVIGVRLLQLIQKEMTLTFDQIFLWFDSQLVLDWIASNNETKRFCFKQIARNS